jgi:hypothetical protein
MTTTVATLLNRCPPSQHDVSSPSLFLQTDISCVKNERMGMNRMVAINPNVIRNIFRVQKKRKRFVEKEYPTHSALSNITPSSEMRMM